MRLATLLALVLALTAGSQAQGECPFSPEEAVADTLDAEGYYPLALGNVWEYRTFSDLPVTPGELRREEVVGDTLVDGVRHWALQTTLYRQSGPDTLVAVVEPCCSYRAVDDAGVLVRDLTIETVRLAHPLNACYRPEGGFLTLVERPPVANPLIKSFSDPVSYRAYEFGWGPVQIDGGGQAFVTYARVGDRTRGSTFADGVRVVVPTEGGPDAVAPVLRLWPNPASSWVVVDGLAAAATPGVGVRVYDALGRLVIAETVGTWGGGLRLDIRSLSSGTYRVVVEAGRQPPASVPFTVL